MQCCFFKKKHIKFGLVHEALVCHVRGKDTRPSGDRILSPLAGMLRKVDKQSEWLLAGYCLDRLGFPPQIRRFELWELCSSYWR